MAWFFEAAFVLIAVFGTGFSTSPSSCPLLSPFRALCLTHWLRLEHLPKTWLSPKTWPKIQLIGLYGLGAMHRPMTALSWSAARDTNNARI